MSGVVCNRSTYKSRSCAVWQAELAESVRSPAELCRLLGLDPRLVAAAEASASEFPLLAPRPYLSRIRRGDPTDPLLLQILPQPAESDATPGYSADPLCEAAATCGPGLLRKYQGRLLMVTTPACGVHCRFCFRRHFLRPASSHNGDSEPSAPCHSSDGPSPGVYRSWRTNLPKIDGDASIREIILSGGDPLTLDDAEMADLVGEVATIPHVARVRVHSRLPVVIPSRVTDGLLSGLRGSRLSPIMVVHVNHPAEIDAAVAGALGRLVDAGIPVLSQSVLLRGVNDRAEVLAEVYQHLADIRVIPYYLHQLDAVAGAAHFAVPIESGKALIEELRARLPGYAVPRYVRETAQGASKEILA